MTKNQIQSFARLFGDAWSEFSRDNAMRLSAALSYYSIFSIAPLLLIAVGFAGWVYGDKAAQGKIAIELTEFIGATAAKAVQSVIESASKATSGATIIGFVTLVVGASTVFAQLKDALNTIWKVKQKEGLGLWIMVRERLFSFGLVLAVGFLLLVSLVVTTTVTALAGWLEHRFGVPAFVSGFAGYVMPLILETLLFAMIFKILPDAYIKWQDVWVGASVTALLFEAGKIGLSFYLGRGSATSSFGAAGSVVLLLLWIYYASCILFFGAEFTEVYARAHGHYSQPAPTAEATEVWTEKGRMPVGCLDSPLVVSARASIAGSGDRHPERELLQAPAKETLAPLMAMPETPSRNASDVASAKVDRESDLEALLTQAHGHPVAELGVALGIGLAAGTLMRLGTRTPEASAQEHFRWGSKAALAVGAATLAGLGPWLRRYLDRKSLIL